MKILHLLICERLTVHTADPRLRPDNNHYNHNNVPRIAIVRTIAVSTSQLHLSFNGRRIVMIVAVIDQINVIKGLPQKNVRFVDHQNKAWPTYRSE